MRTSRSTVISNIIEKRRPLAEQISKAEANLKSLDIVLHHLKDGYQKLVADVNETNINNTFRDTNFEIFIESVNREVVALEKLKSRFSRDTLKIGVVGRTRQGKSRLLQSLTGLTASEIPDGDRQHCTGVRSTIYHKPNVETYAEVWFHSEQSFLDEIIIPYYEKLYLGSKPVTVEEFATNPLPNLPDELRGSAVNGAMYDHLTRYYRSLSSYRHLLRESSPRRILGDEIREYVAQDTVDGERIYFNYLAVREVNIFCPFPNVDVEQIALVDMPGLGDTGIGDEERLVKTLGQDVDAVLFVRMPKSSGDYWADVDVHLYDLARNALIDLPINLWSFLILNQTDANSKNGDNSKNCQDLAGDISRKSINVSDWTIANCASAEDSNKVLDQVLTYLAANINTLDKQYASINQQRLYQIQKDLATELEKAGNIFSNSNSNGIESLFDDLFDSFWREITSGLEELLKTLMEQRNIQDDFLKSQVQDVLRQCKDSTGIPAIERIKSENYLYKAYGTTYNNFLHKVRTHLSKHFLYLDDGLKHSIEEAKSLVTDVLVESGSLGKLTEERGSDFLKRINDLIPDSLHNLKLGFQIISDFNLSYRGLIQHRIREHLDLLTPDLTLRLPQNPSEQDVFETLTELHSEVVFKCEEALQDFLTEPSKAAFAMVEEFVDQVLRADRVEREWREFLRENREQLWSEQLTPMIENAGKKTEWLNLVKQASSINEPPNLSF